MHSHRKLDSDHINPEIYLQGAMLQVSRCDVCFDFDIPYAGGIDVSGTYGFIHRALKDKMIYSNTKGTWDISKFWMLHELVEFSHEKRAGQDQLVYLSRKYMETRDVTIVIGPQDSEFDYKPSHQFAEHLERAYVEYMGLDWDEYDAYCDGLIKIAEDAPVEKCPANLYLQPYENEKDMNNLYAIIDAGGPVSYMTLAVGQRGGDDGRPWWGT